MATYNPYETRRLIGVVANLPPPASFLLNMFFKKEIRPTGARKIMFDVESQNKGIALLCNPIVAGRPVRERGYFTKEIEPAYMKPWMNFDPYGVLDRMVGEAPVGELDPAARQSARLVRGFNDLKTIAIRRYEVMAATALITGKVVISGEGIPTDIEVDFGRKAGFTKALTSTVRWNENGVSPVSDLETWVAEFIAESGYAPTRVSFDPLAWKALRADPLFKDSIDLTYKRNSEAMGIDYLMLGNSQQGQLMGSLKSGGNIELWVYQQTYLNETGATAKVVPDFSVIIGSENPEITQTMAWGTVIDPELGYQSEQLRDPETGARLEFAPSHWFQSKPHIGEAIMLQSAGLPALTNPNGTMGITVR